MEITGKLVYDPKIIHDNILNIVNDNSGGIKFTELITILLTNYRHNLDGWQNDDNLDKLSDIIEKIIRESSDMKILNYTWILMKRTKMFVYTE